MPSELDLFGFERPVLSPLERKRMLRRAAERPRGHAARPGTGPAGETCGSCEHLVRRQRSKTYPKCGLNRAGWTCGPASDVRVRDPACSKWEKPE
ncbi:hypothetical protein ASF58_23370 [Methylobacterium sp. Leaf125]|uniref:hypothetical protein n=1 Tax=Methylobacterium sp. Leaf125 TaxID=1736265 RepID=UPI0006FB1A7A|nr:hypothetical protein [Methylobacterium sp. Leaf125]KQQ39084.1 hypothetical protein ASF58_23370 [Methylobacterium sp. Leaf125]